MSSGLHTDSPSASNFHGGCVRACAVTCLTRDLASTRRRRKRSGKTDLKFLLLSASRLRSCVVSSISITYYLLNHILHLRPPYWPYDRLNKISNVSTRDLTYYIAFRWNVLCGEAFLGSREPREVSVALQKIMTRIYIRIQPIRIPSPDRGRGSTRASAEACGTAMNEI